MCVQLWVVIELPVPARERYNIIVRDMALYIRVLLFWLALLKPMMFVGPEDLDLYYMRAYKDDR
jgi:hypothetical protein